MVKVRFGVLIFLGEIMIPIDVIKILDTFKSNGFEAFIVGGAVRDYCLKRVINDWDITTNAEPDVIESLFEKTYSVGRSFGTIVVVLNDIQYEITTYRTESAYSDGRRPDNVVYTSDLKEDLARRDFTMNSMVMDRDENITDVYNGKKSIDNCEIETVGQARLRFTEDYLRVYRYVRFTSQLNFDRNKKLDFIIKNMPINKTISFERIQVELNKILLSKEPSRGIQHLKDIGLLSYIFPGIEKTYNFDQHSKYHHLNIFDHLLCTLDYSKTTLINRLSALLHDIGKPNTFELIDGEGHFYKHHKASRDIAETILVRLKYSNHQIDVILNLIHYHMTVLDLDNVKSVKKFINKIGSEQLENFLDLRESDIKSCKTNDDLKSINEMRITFTNIIEQKHPMTVNDLDLSGYDLMALGYKGKNIGLKKEELLEHVLQFPEDNTKDKLLRLIRPI